MSNANGGYDANGKSPREIEHDIGETRAELGAVIDAIERRLQPRALVELGFETLRGKMELNAARIDRTLRDHPVPLALIGAGLAWFAIDGIAGDAPARMARRMGSRIGASARVRMSDEIEAMEESAAGEEMAGYAYARTKSGAAATAAAALETVRNVRAGMVRAVVNDPLVLGVVGLCAGLALALLLPRSAAEQRVIDPVRRQVRSRADEIRRHAVDRAQDLAERAADGIAEAIKPAAD